MAFIGADPYSDGGISNYQKNLIKYFKSKNKNIEITLVYKSYKNEKKIKDGINYVGLNPGKIPFIGDFIFNKKVGEFLNRNYFDIIISHAIWGYWMKNYNKKRNELLINVYHGVTFPYYKIHLKRFKRINRSLLSPLLLYGYLIERPPIKKADKIICVSEKVKKQIEEVYGKRKNVFIIRTGVDLSSFKPRDKNSSRKKIKLEKDKIYGISVGGGGYWIKGLDRTIKLSEEIYKTDKKFRLIVIGYNREKVKELIKKPFIIYREKILREVIPLYYNSSDLSFSLSRYEGGAPILVVSEAMASGCLVICSKDSQQEIIYDNQNGIIINKFDKNDARRILEILKNRKIRKGIIKNSIKTIKNISLEKWGEEYSKVVGI